MTITEAKATPVPAPVLLAHRIQKARVQAERADQDAAQAMSEAQQAHARLETLEAEQRTMLGLAA